MTVSWRNSSSQRAFTLVEVLVAVVVGFLLLGVLYSTFFSSVKQFSVNQTNLEAVSIAQTVLDIVQSSASRQIVSLEVEESVLQPAGPMDSLSLRVCEVSERGIYKGVEQVFSLTPHESGEYSYFTLNGKVHKNLSVSKLTFEVLKTESIATSQQLYFLVVSVTATTPVSKDAPTRKEYTLQGLVALDEQSSLLAGNHWNPNPFIYKHF